VKEAHECNRPPGRECKERTVLSGWRPSPKAPGGVKALEKPRLLSKGHSRAHQIRALDAVHTKDDGKWGLAKSARGPVGHRGDHLPFPKYISRSRL